MKTPLLDGIEKQAALHPAVIGALYGVPIGAVLGGGLGAGIGALANPKDRGAGAKKGLLIGGLTGAGVGGAGMALAANASVKGFGDVVEDIFDSAMKGKFIKGKVHS